MESVCVGVTIQKGEQKMSVNNLVRACEKCGSDQIIFTKNKQNTKCLKCGHIGDFAQYKRSHCPNCKTKTGWKQIEPTKRRTTTRHEFGTTENRLETSNLLQCEKCGLKKTNYETDTEYIVDDKPKKEWYKKKKWR